MASNWLLRIYKNCAPSICHGVHASPMHRWSISPVTLTNWKNWRWIGKHHNEPIYPMHRYTLDDPGSIFLTRRRVRHSTWFDSLWKKYLPINSLNGPQAIWYITHKQRVFNRPILPHRIIRLPIHSPIDE